MIGNDASTHATERQADRTPGGAELREVAAQAMERFRVPGVSIGVVHRGASVTFGLGITNVRYPLPVDEETLFQAGSITKLVTATAVMRLVEQDVLRLDQPIRAYLPDLQLADPGVAANLTLTHLLTHSVGWAEVSVGKMLPPDTGPGDDALARVVARLRELDQECPPGERWSYSNHAFALLGRVLEVATGRTFEQAVLELVLAPLAMTDSFFAAADVITRCVAAGHWQRPTGPMVAEPWALPRSAGPAGGLIMTIGDLLAFARFHLGDGAAADGTRLLESASLAAMRAPRLAAGWMADAVGLSWYVRESGSVRVVGHDGIVNGQQSALLLVPEHDFGLAVLTNSDRGAEVIYEVAGWALRAYLGLAAPTAFDRYLAMVRSMVAAG